jgi:hypothetical protein
MSNGKSEPERPKPKDNWDRADIILKFVGSLLTAVVIGSLGYWGSKIIEDKRNADAKTRLYTELMSKREDSENSLRKDMFVSIINSFLKTDLTKGQQDPESRVLELELLAYNFHESLDLKPLFVHLRRQIEAANLKNGNDYLYRLEKVAREIIDKQMLVLEEAAGSDGKRDQSIDLLAAPAIGKPQSEEREPLFLKPIDLTLNDVNNRPITRSVAITVLGADPKRKEIDVRVTVRTQLNVQLNDNKIGPTFPFDTQGTNNKAESTSVESQDIEFNTITRQFAVGPFDFPFIDNIRLSNDQRLAMVLKGFAVEEQRATITLVLFPGSHASLREKPFFQEIIQKLQLDEK